MHIGIVEESDGGSTLVRIEDDQVIPIMPTLRVGSLVDPLREALRLNIEFVVSLEVSL